MCNEWVECGWGRDAVEESLPADDVDDVDVIIEGCVGKWWWWLLFRFNLLAAAISEPMLWPLLVVLLMLMLWLIDMWPVGD